MLRPFRSGYGILWDNYAVSHVNEPDPAEDEITLAVTSGSGPGAARQPPGTPLTFNDTSPAPTFGTAEFVAQHDGDHHFLVSTCNGGGGGGGGEGGHGIGNSSGGRGTRPNSSTSFPPSFPSSASSSSSSGSPYQWPPTRWSPVVRLSLRDRTTHSTHIVLDWDGLTNMPCSLAARARALVAGRTYTVTLELKAGATDGPAESDAHVAGDTDVASGVGASTGGHGHAESAEARPAPQVVRLFVRRPADTWQLSSELGALVDYYYIFGGRTGGGGGGSAGVHYEQTVRGGGSGGGSKMDSVVAGYRRLTGAAPLYPRWAFGFWQCKEHYASQVQVQDAVAEFRRRQIPLDAIVQDWQYWGRRGWGPHWDHRRYPDPKL
jgi:alpha-glucosidase (family GH31 glycosyl hydrolase)